MLPGEMVSRVQSGALVGVEAVPVSIEVSVGLVEGEDKFRLVGLPDAAVRESLSRVMSALVSAKIRGPHGFITVNLAPGDLRKEGPLYDLPIALGFAASVRPSLQTALDRYLLAGELGLAGDLRPVRGGLALARLARQRGLRGIILPAASAAEAALIDGLEVHAAHTLREAFGFLAGESPLERVPSPMEQLRAAARAHAPVDFAEVKGQAAVRRAVEVAVAGAHNLLLVGPPGSGKSMIAKRIPTVMPEPDEEEFLDIMAVHSAAGRTLDGGVPLFRRPFRSPHHTISDAGLIGGGSIPGPGEISLAHRGVLFLDELPEFRRAALELLRQPLEDASITISRSAAKVTLPCDFVLVAAMNPCPCGHLGDPRRSCRCGPLVVQRYRNRLSGPLLDRIDLHVEAPALSIDELATRKPAEGSAAVRERIEAARERQRLRLMGTGIPSNARMPPALLQQHCALTPELVALLRQAMERLRLSARAWDRVLKVARTIADLAGRAQIAAPDLLEALQYRSLDRRMTEGPEGDVPY